MFHQPFIASCNVLRPTAPFVRPSAIMILVSAQYKLSTSVFFSFSLNHATPTNVEHSAGALSTGAVTADATDLASMTKTMKAVLSCGGLSRSCFTLFYVCGP